MVRFEAPGFKPGVVHFEGNKLVTEYTGKLRVTDESLRSYLGTFALYSGCIWGDDDSWRVRYIDISKISKGIVTEEERFGYLPLAYGNKPSSLKDIYLDSGKYLSIPTEITFDLKTGCAQDIYFKVDEKSVKNL